MPEHINNTLLKPPEKKFDHSIIFFDWDDSLCPSSFLSYNNISPLDGFIEPFQEKLELLSSFVITLIETIHSLSTKIHPVTFVIVTNAEHGWVELSAQKFMPKLYKYLISNDIQIISAKSTFATELDTQPHIWKYMAFLSILNSKCGYDYFTDKNINIISVGDSLVERAALKKIEEFLPQAVCKSIKMAERQNIDIIINQLKLMISCWSTIIHHPGCLDLVLNVDHNNNNDNDNNQSHKKNQNNIDENNNSVIVEA